MILFFVDFFILSYVGLKPAEGLYLLIARIGLIYYFAFFLVITPFMSRFEKSIKLPESISESFENNIKKSSKTFQERKG